MLRFRAEHGTRAVEEGPPPLTESDLFWEEEEYQELLTQRKKRRATDPEPVPAASRKLPGPK